MTSRTESRGPASFHANDNLKREKKVSSPIYKLTRIHRSLDEAIAGELTRRLPDSFKLLRLKRLRLGVKDRLTALMTRRVSA